MKKYILSFLVISTFAVYAVYQRISGGGDPVVLGSENPNLATNTVPSPTEAVVTPTFSATHPPTPTATTVPVKSVSPTPAPTQKLTPTPTPVVVPKGQYKDGQYTGVSADAYYGYIQVEATISGGRLTDVQFLDYPQDRSTSRRINSQAMPYLKQEAIQAQSANVNTVSGASDSSGAFRQSLASALVQAKNS